MVVVESLCEVRQLGHSGRPSGRRAGRGRDAGACRGGVVEGARRTALATRLPEWRGRALWRGPARGPATMAGVKGLARPRGTAGWRHARRVGGKHQARARGPRHAPPSFEARRRPALDHADAKTRSRPSRAPASRPSSLNVPGGMGRCSAQDRPRPAEVSASTPRIQQLTERTRSSRPALCTSDRCASLLAGAAAAYTLLPEERVEQRGGRPRGGSPST